MNETWIADLQATPLATVVAYYATRLAANPKAIEYLERNALLPASDKTPAVGVSPPDVVAIPPGPMIGFADRTLGRHIPLRVTKLGQTIRKQLEKLGVFRPNGREHFRGMVTMPLYSAAGDVTGIYGRRIDLTNGGAREQHIGQGIFNAAVLSQVDELIITDTVLDAWTFYAAGHTNVICCVECELPREHLQKLQRVVLASPDLDAHGLGPCQAHRIELPAGHTPNSYVRKYGHQADPLAKLLRNATWESGSGRLPVPTSPSPDCQQVPQGQQVTQPEVAANTQDNTVTPPKTTPAPRASEGLDVQASDTETTITIESRRWRIRGLDRNTVVGVMRVNVMVFNERSDRFHVDTFDVYHARSRRTFLAEAAEEIGAAESQLRSDLGQVLLKLEELQHEQQQSKTSVAGAIALTDSEQAAALELLRSENLLDRILDDFDACGIVGERTGKLVGYLAATSRLLDKPLGLVIQSSSAAGKSSLADAILKFMPQEDRFTCSAMTSQSLYYLGNENLKHKILSVAEEEGVRDASYQLKLLQSEGSLSLISTSKEKGSGRTSTERYTVEGPVALLLTTTATDVDPELMNRCLVVSVDESPAQTAAIHAQQRHARTLEGFTQTLEAAKLVKLHQNAQRLLKPLRIYNPYAEQLGFVGSQTRYRRDHEKYLTLISSVALLHQYQREIKTTEVDGQSYQYLEVTRHDIALANRIADWALGRSIDELPGPTRRLLIELGDWIRGEADKQKIQPTEFTFTRREAREALQWNATHLRNHLERLALHEYVIPQGRGQGRLHRYSLLYDGRGREGQPLLLGLVDAASLIEPVLASTTGNLAQQ